MLVKDSKTRITLAETKAHAWFVIAQESIELIPEELFLNMKSYQADNKLRNEAMLIIVKNLHYKEIM